MESKAIQKLVNLFSKFPTVGQRTASRFVFYIIRMSPDKIEEIISSVKELKSSVRLCSSCFNPFEINPSASSGQEATLCPICQDKARNSSLLCIVEKEADLISIENTKKYKGLYFILGGTINLKKGKEEIRIEELKERVKKGSFQEIILALNSTAEGEATSLFIEREFQKLSSSEKLSFKLTKLGRGLPVGGEVEYADEETLSSAFEARK